MTNQIMTHAMWIVALVAAAASIAEAAIVRFSSVAGFW
jgi:hypothetical protein